MDNINNHLYPGETYQEQKQQPTQNASSSPMSNLMPLMSMLGGGKDLDISKILPMLGGMGVSQDKNQNIGNNLNPLLSMLTSKDSPLFSAMSAKSKTEKEKEKKTSFPNESKIYEDYD